MYSVIGMEPLLPGAMVRVPFESFGPRWLRTLPVTLLVTEFSGYGDVAVAVTRICDIRTHLCVWSAALRNQGEVDVLSLSESVARTACIRLINSLVERGVVHDVLGAVRQVRNRIDPVSCSVELYVRFIRNRAVSVLARTRNPFLLYRVVDVRVDV